MGECCRLIGAWYRNKSSGSRDNGRFSGSCLGKCLLVCKRWNAHCWQGLSLLLRHNWNWSLTSLWQEGNRYATYSFYTETMHWKQLNMLSGEKAERRWKDFPSFTHAITCLSNTRYWGSSAFPVLSNIVNMLRTGLRAWFISTLYEKDTVLRERYLKTASG